MILSTTTIIILVAFAGQQQVLADGVPGIGQVLLEAATATPNQASNNQKEFTIRDPIQDLSWLHTDPKELNQLDSMASMSEPTLISQLEMMPGQRRFDELASALDDSTPAESNKHHRSYGRSGSASQGMIGAPSEGRGRMEGKNQLRSQRRSIFDDDEDAMNNNPYRSKPSGRNNNRGTKNAARRRQAESAAAAAARVEESRDQVMRPFVSGGGDGGRHYKADDIFSNDGTIEDEADRRSDDDDDEMDDGDELEEVASAARDQRMQRVANSQQRSHNLNGPGRNSPPESNEPLRRRAAAGEGLADYDEETDSSNDNKKAMLVRDRVRQVKGDNGGNKHLQKQKLPKKQSVAKNAATKRNQRSSTESFEDQSASYIKNSKTDLNTAAGHHHGHSHGHYYEYREVPKKKAWKFGFKRGNHKHTIERHEKGYKNKFHSSFKWHATEKCKKKKKCKSVGSMKWEYKHHDKKKKHGHYGKK